MQNKFLATAVLSFALLAAGCGDDDGASPFGPESLGDSGSSGDIDLGDLDGLTDDILEDLADGSLDEGDLDGLMENAENMAESLGGSGGGSVTVGGDTIEFTSEICFSGQGDFTIEGPGTTSDGTPAWVSISQTTEAREDLVEFLGEEMVQNIYGDADTIIGSDFSVEYGRTELFGSGDDELPDYAATTGAGGTADVDMSVDGQSASGSGTATDYNGDFGETHDFSFQAACS